MACPVIARCRDICRQLSREENICEDPLYEWPNKELAFFSELPGKNKNSYLKNKPMHFINTQEQPLLDHVRFPASLLCT
jgi:hypothetical protein